MKHHLLSRLALIGCASLLLTGCGKKLDPRAEIPLPPPSPTAPVTNFDPKSSGFTNAWLEWSREMIVDGYDRAGRKNPAWNNPAHQALEEYAHLRVTGQPRDPDRPNHLKEQLELCALRGCNDPLIRYIHMRMFLHPPESATPEIASAYKTVAMDMEASNYDQLLKFFVNLRTAQAWRVAFAKQAPEVNQFRRVAMNHLQSVLSGSDIPAPAAFEACQDLYKAIDQNKKQRADFYENAEPVLLNKWPKEAFPHLLKAKFYLDYAWEARGTGWAKDVTEDGWKLFGDRLTLVDEALNTAWKLNPQLPETPLVAMRLEVGQGRGRDQLELWYKRALAFPQSRYEAVRLKLWYLQPRWHGSEEECLEFAREVLKSDLFTDQTPLHLYHTHVSFATFFKDSRPNYWTEPQVWPDIKACFERYFELNGEDNSWRHNYVMCAWKCQQWKTLDEQIRKLTQVNYEYFGGQEAFGKMAQTAQEHVQGGN